MKNRHLLIPIITALLLLAIVPGASAHRPLWSDGKGVTEIPDIVTSFAVYRDLKVSGQLDLYSFEAQAGDHLHAGVNVPAVGGLEHYGVSVALLGPGLPEPRPGALPMDDIENMGAVVFEHEVTDDFFEPFTQTNYWGRQRVSEDLPATGTYYLAVWQPEGVPGKYVLDVGTAEVFGPGDLLRFPFWWLRVHMYFGHGPYLLALIVPLAALALVVGLRRRRALALAAAPRAER